MQRDAYPAGVPCWIDIEVADLDVATTFYSGLFGWEFEDVPPAAAGEAADTARVVARLGGGTVAGLTAAPAAGPGRDHDVAWTTYVAVEDLDAVAQRVVTRGGRIVAEPIDRPDHARVAVCADPAGARFGLWEPHGNGGAEQVNVPGTWNMSELHAPDVKAFYAAVFGWRFDLLEFGDAVSYLVRLPGYGDLLERLDPTIRERQAQDGVPTGFADAVAWMEPLDASSGDSPHWSVTFACDDADRLAERAASLGGEVVVPPFDADEHVRLAVLRDPAGAAFTVNRYAPALADRS